MDLQQVTEKERSQSKEKVTSSFLLIPEDRLDQLLQVMVA
jgi:hypothetical protein